MINARFAICFSIISLISSSWLASTAFAQPVKTLGSDDAVLTIVVMDPLSKPLACDCVQGYAQRRYEALAEYLEKKLKTSCRVVWADSLENTWQSDPKRRADLIIGKDSVVRFQAAEAKVDVRPVAILTDKQGETTQRGLFVVSKESTAASLLDIEDWQILLGPKSCGEKNAAPLQSLAEVDIQVQIGATCESCAVAAKQLLAEQTRRTVAVISSYAAPLLEGCGNIKKGDLRVIGESGPVPFVTVFADAKLDSTLIDKLHDSLIAIGDDAELKVALETRDGFVEYSPSAEKGKSPSDSSMRSHSWNQFRGSSRNGQVTGIPDGRLNPKKVWEMPLPGTGIGGIAATSEMVVVSGRDANDQNDVFHILDPSDGALIYKHEYPAPGRLDYGNSPRATPIIDDDFVFVLGAMGHLTAINPDEGRVVWRKNLRNDLGGQLPTWGYCNSPLISANRLFVQPGGKDSAIAALDKLTGEVLWMSAGRRAAYASLMFIADDKLAADGAVVGCDESGLVAWSAKDGKELWRLKPQQPGEFMVPSPVVTGKDLLWLGESNGLRVFEFDSTSQASTPRQRWSNSEVTSDTATPTVTGDLIVVPQVGSLSILSLSSGKISKELLHDSIDGYTALFAEDDHILACCTDGTWLLINLESGVPRVADQTQPHRYLAPIYSHPALVDGWLYIRHERAVVCFQLATE